MTLGFPKPGKKKTPAIRVFKDGREKCNLNTKEGRDIYMGRIEEMRGRQGNRCSLQGLIEGCPGFLAKKDATFDHDEGRGMGGGHVDDRILIPNKDTGELEPVNGAAHALCNSKKASVRKSLLLDLSDVP